MKVLPNQSINQSPGATTWTQPTVVDTPQPPWLAFKGHAAVLKLLVDAGADLTAKCGNNKTALQ